MNHFGIYRLVRANGLANESYRQLEKVKIVPGIITIGEKKRENIH